jgi:hypothetical protein
MLYLVAHTAPNGTNVAQAAIEARTLAAAHRAFAERYPGRVLTIIEPIGGRA